LNKTKIRGQTPVKIGQPLLFYDGNT